jgi:hypothetical protein
MLTQCQLLIMLTRVCVCPYEEEGLMRRRRRREGNDSFRSCVDGQLCGAFAKPCHPAKTHPDHPDTQLHAEWLCSICRTQDRRNRKFTTLRSSLTTSGCVQSSFSLQYTEARTRAPPGEAMLMRATYSTAPGTPWNRLSRQLSSEKDANSDIQSYLQSYVVMRGQNAYSSNVHDPLRHWGQTVSALR